MAKPLNFIILGISGSGKGTQIELLAKKLEATQKLYISTTGDLLRELLKQDSAVATRLKVILDKGELAPPSLAVALWLQKAAYTLQEDTGIIFDGSPRSVWETKAVDDFLTLLGRTADTRVLYIKVSPEEITKRLLGRGRYDDREDAIKGRIAFFHKDVVPVIEHYRAKGMLIEIDGELSPEEIHDDIVAKLGL
jgi:adenylate kinase